MASTPNKVVVRIGADVAGLLKGMNEAFQSVKTMTGGVQTNLATMATASKASSQELTAAVRSAGFSIGDLATSIATLGTAWKAFNLGRAFVDAGIEMNAGIQSAKLGIASIITAQASLRDANGETLTGVEKLTAAYGLAADQVQKLRIAGIQTAATTQELIQAYKSALAPGLGAGMSLDQIRQITVLATQAAGAMGIQMEDMPHHMTAIIGGMRTMQSLLARNLGLNAEIIRGWRESGTLFEHLNAVLGAYGVAGEQIMKSWAGVTSTIRDAYQLLAGEITKPLFEQLSAGLNESLGGAFNVAAGKISESFRGLVDAGQEVFRVLGEGARTGLQAVVNTLQDMSKWLGENKERVTAFMAAVAALGAAAVSAFSPLASSLVSLVTNGIGPLTTGLNVMGAILGTTVGKLAALGLAGATSLTVFGNMVSMFGRLNAAGFGFAGIGVAMRALSAAAAPVVAGLGRIADGYVLLRTVGTGTIAALSESLRYNASTLLSSINPWVALAVAVTAAGAALIYFAGARERAARAAEQAAKDAVSQAESFRRQLDETLEIERKIASPETGAKDRAGLAVQLNAQLQELKQRYPELAAGIDQVLASEKSLAEFRDEAAARAARDVDRRIAAVNQEIEAVRQRNATLKEAGTHADDVMDPTLGGTDWNEARAKLAAYNNEMRANDQLLQSLGRRLAELQREKGVISAPAAAPVTVHPTGTGDTGTDKSGELVQKWREELESIKALRANWFSFDNQQELAFWEKKLALTKAGTDAHREVLTTVNRLEMQIGKEGHEREIAELQAHAAALKGQGEARLVDLREVLSRQSEAYGYFSTQATAAQKALTAAVGEESDLRVSKLRAEADEIRTDGQARLELMRQSIAAAIEGSRAELAAARATYGPSLAVTNAEIENTQRVIEARKKYAAVEREVAQQVLAARQHEIEVQKDYALKGLEIEQQHLEAMKSKGLISENQYIAQMLVFESRRHQIELDALAAERAGLELEFQQRLVFIGEQAKLDGFDLERLAQHYREIEDLKKQHALRMKELDDKTAGEDQTHAGNVGGIGDQKAPNFGQQLTGGIESGIQGMTGAWADGLQKMLEGTLSFSDAVKGLWKGLANSIISSIIQVTTRYIVQKILELVFHRNTEAEKTTETTTETGIRITAHAAEGAVAAGAANAGKNWVYGIAVAAAVFAALIAYRSMASAEGGMDVGLENPQAQLHMREMVLPRPLAERVRAITEPVTPSMITAAVIEHQARTQSAAAPQQGSGVPGTSAVTPSAPQGPAERARTLGQPIRYDLSPQALAPAFRSVRAGGDKLAAREGGPGLGTTINHITHEGDTSITIKQGNVSAWDSRDAGRAYRRTSGELVKILGELHRDGRLIPWNRKRGGA